MVGVVSLATLPQKSHRLREASSALEPETMRLKLFPSCTTPLWHVVVFVLMLDPRACLRPVRALLPTFGYRQRPSTVTFSSVAQQSRIDADCAVAIDDPVLAIRRYTEAAIQHRGQPKGFAALEKLGDLCAVRKPYEFNDGKEEKDGTVVALQKDLLPPLVTEAFLDQVKEMEKHGWLSTNPDSVDGLPSLHLNLISGGKPTVSPDQESLDDFQRGLQNLLTIVKPYVYEELLPNVQTMMNDPSIVISDVFLRRYGQDILQDGASSRNGISAHYDVFSKVTAVIAMDNVASEGNNGLYTTATSSIQSTKTSNHASLRRYFPLEKGDGVVHSWDVLHGVNVLQGTDRTSLIVWFTTQDVLKSSETITSPWLVDHPDIETDDVAQFVLASATEGVETDPSLNPDAMYHREEVRRSSATLKKHPHDLFLKSAASGNAFALTRLGSLAQEKKLSLERATQGLAILQQLRPQDDGIPLKEEVLTSNGGISFEALANRFWFEGAVRGNPLAQAALADEIMERSVLTGSQDLRILASVLFGLAAQQGHESASTSLSRVVEYEVAQRAIQTQEEFESSPVIRTAQSAMSIHFGL